MQRRKVTAPENHIGGVGENRFPPHGDTELLANNARRTVGSNQIVGDDLVFPSRIEIAKRCRNACAAFLKIDQFRSIAEFDRAELTGEAAKDRIEHVLRAPFPLLGTLRWTRFFALAGHALAAKLEAGQGFEPDVILRIVARVRRILDPTGNSPSPAELHGANADHVHSGLIDRAVGLFDQTALHASPAEISGQSEPDWPRADNEDRYLPAGHSNKPPSHMRCRRQCLCSTMRTGEAIV